VLQQPVSQLATTGEATTTGATATVGAGDATKTLCSPAKTLVQTKQRTKVIKVFINPP
jgi:hypothetical protein